MTPKEAFERLMYGRYDTTEEKVKYRIIVGNALDRLEELEKENKFLTKELKKQDKELVGLTRALKIIKEYILKDMAVFTNGEMAYVQFKCDKDLVCYAIPYEKLYEIKEYLL